MPRRPGAHAPLTRTAITGAAIRLFQQRGFSTLGMRQIADCLSIKAPSLYYHFASKEALAAQALRQYREEQEERLQAIDRTLPPHQAAAKLHAYADLFTRMLDDGGRPCLYLVLMREPAFRQGEGAEELERFVRQNIDWLERTLTPAPTPDAPPKADTAPKANKAPKANTGAAAQADPRVVAELTFAGLEGLMALCLTAGGDGDGFRRRADTYLRMAGYPAPGAPPAPACPT